jgi:hypothetical protein
MNGLGVVDDQPFEDVADHPNHSLEVADHLLGVRGWSAHPNHPLRVVDHPFGEGVVGHSIGGSPPTPTTPWVGVGTGRILVFSKTRPAVHRFEIQHP